jgi:antirestriction protein
MTAYEAYAASTANPCREHFDSIYIGKFETPADFAEHLLESTGELAKVPQYLQAYLDLEGFAEDRLLAGGIRRSGKYWFWT